MKERKTYEQVDHAFELILRRWIDQWGSITDRKSFESERDGVLRGAGWTMAEYAVEYARRQHKYSSSTTSESSKVMNHATNRTRRGQRG